MPKPNFDRIPDDMKKLHQWVCYTRNKIPIIPFEGTMASVTDKRTWSKYEECKESVEQGIGVGVGFVLTKDDPYLFIDFDKIHEDAKAQEKAKLLDTYTELSPSGHGLHCFFKVNKDDLDLPKNKSECGKYEVYAYGRYATVTGWTQPDSEKPKPVRWGQEKAQAFINSTLITEKFTTEVESRVEYDPSEMEDINIIEVESMLNKIDPRTLHYHDWLKVGMALKTYGCSISVWDNWSQQNIEKYKPGECASRWHGFNDEVGIGSLVFLAKRAGWERNENVNIDIDALITDFATKVRDKDELLVTRDEVKNVLRDTALASLCGCMAIVTEPPLPLEMVLGKAMVLLGSALAYPDGESNEFGHHRAKIKIGGGATAMTTNMYCCTVAESGSGKDIGNIFTRVANNMGWLVPAGSKEGVQDALVDRHVAVMAIDELNNFIEKGNWEHKLTDFLTGLYSKLSYDVAMSKRGAGAGLSRKNNYAALSIMANIQPNIFKRKIDSDLLHGGFMPRFLFFCPPFEDIDVVRMANENVDDMTPHIQKLVEDIMYGVPPGSYTYDQEPIIKWIKVLRNKSLENKFAYERLLKENAKKIALLIAIGSNGNLVLDKPMHLDYEIVDRACKVCVYLYERAKIYYSTANKSLSERSIDEVMDKYIDFVKNSKGEKCFDYVLRSRYPKYKKLVGNITYAEFMTLFLQEGLLSCVGKGNEKYYYIDEKNRALLKKRR